MATVEPVFGNLQNKARRHLTLRGRKKVDARWQLFTMVHNIGKIAGWRRLGGGPEQVDANASISAKASQPTVRLRTQEPMVHAFQDTADPTGSRRSDRIARQSSRLRGVTGSQYRDFNAAFRDHLALLGIPYDYVQTDCEHNYGCPLERQGQNSWALLQAEFRRRASASAP